MRHVAAVALKERRRLVLMVREAPLHAGHIRDILSVPEMGGVILSTVPAFYTKPHVVQDIVDHSVARALDCFGLEVPDVKRWGEPAADGPADILEAGPAYAGGDRVVEVAATRLGRHHGAPRQREDAQVRLHPAHGGSGVLVGFPLCRTAP